jgi:D-alanine-D-alanine ligase
VRIAVIYDHAADTGGSADVTGVLDSVHAVVAALAGLGHAAFPISVGPPLDRFLARLSAVDMVFNLAEGLDGRADGEPRVAALLELAGRATTGASSDTLALCRRKDRVNALLGARGLPIPPWSLLAPDRAGDWSLFPAIVKPAGEDGSVGIHEWSVADDALELTAALDRLGGEALVQRFVTGRELNVGIVGGVVLPVAEIEFSGRQRVVSYAAKWDAGSAEDRSTHPICPARIPVALHAEVCTMAREAWAVVGGRGYGRVDLRTDDEGRPFLLDVNPNPDLAPDAGLARMAGAAGWSYADLVERIVLEAAP